jgi:hypothetical protein
VVQPVPIVEAKVQQQKPITPCNAVDMATRCNRPKGRSEVYAAEEIPTGLTIAPPTRKARLERQRLVRRRSSSQCVRLRSSETVGTIPLYSFDLSLNRLENL